MHVFVVEIWKIKIYESIRMIKLSEIEVKKEEFYGAKKHKEIWDVDVINIIVSDLFQVKKGIKCLIRYSDNVIKTLILIIPEMSEHLEMVWW